MEPFRCQWFPSTYLFSLEDSSCLSNLAESLCVLSMDSYKLLVFNIKLMESSRMSEASAGCCNKSWAAENHLESGFQIERWTCLDYVTGRPFLLLIIAADSEQARRLACPFFYHDSLNLCSTPAEIWERMLGWTSWLIFGWLLFRGQGALPFGFIRLQLGMAEVLKPLSAFLVKDLLNQTQFKRVTEKKQFPLLP